MKLIGDYWRTGYCACDVDVRTGSLVVAGATLFISAMMLAIAQFRYSFPATIGLVTGSLAVYAHYCNVKRAYIPLTVQYGMCTSLCAAAFLLSMVAFVASFAGRFDRYLREHGSKYSAKEVRIAAAFLAVAFAFLTGISLWCMRILYGAYRWLKERDARTRHAYPGRVIFEGSVLASDPTASLPAYI